MHNRCSLLALSVLALACACDDDDDGGVGASCSEAKQCFTGLPHDVSGDAVCLDRGEGGYCTHECDNDDDCCAVEGECPIDNGQVCAPFESTGQRLCFLNCVGELDGDAYCAQWT